MKAEFWSLLTDYRSENVFNPWAESDENDAAGNGPGERVERLRDHLDCDAQYLLIGEAPGYRGCHFSGVPFTSEWQYFDSRIASRFAGQRLTSFRLPLKEASASIVYRTLDALGITKQTVFWNAYAFHPYGETVLSNRTPKPREVYDGAKLLTMIVNHLPRARVISVGQIAKRLLEALKIKSVAVRHPSMGGSRQFQDQMVELAK